jgi:hypothetical protein
MHIDLPFFLCALGLAFILEGIPYFLFAEKMPGLLRMLLEKRPADLRKIGVGALLVGLLLIYMGQRFTS